MKKIIINPMAAREAGWDKESLLLALCQICTAKERSRITYKEHDGKYHTIVKDSPDSPSLFQQRHLRLFPETFFMSRRATSQRINKVIGREPWINAMRRLGKSKSVFYHFGNVMWLSNKKEDIKNQNYFVIDPVVFDQTLGYLVAINNVLDYIENLEK